MQRVLMIDESQMTPEELAELERENQTCSEAARVRNENESWHLCDDCGVDTQEIGEQYMVHNHVWTAATGVSHKWLAMMAFLCVVCIEDRLGRQLTKADFAPLGINSDRRRR